MASELVTMDRPWETRDHRKVRLLVTGLIRNSTPVVGIITQPDGVEEVRAWQADGTYCTGQETRTDLIPVVTKHEAWCVVRNNMWWDGSIHVLSHASALAEKERLDKEIPNEEHRIALITWEG